METTEGWEKDGIGWGKNKNHENGKNEVKANTGIGDSQKNSRKCIDEVAKIENY